MAEEKAKAEEVKEAPKAKFDEQRFIERKLKSLNNMADQAKAKALAERLLNR